MTAAWWWPPGPERTRQPLGAGPDRGRLAQVREWASEARSEFGRQAANGSQQRGEQQVGVTEQHRHDERARAAQVAALRREHAGYCATGRTDRAAQVAAVLAELGAPVDDDEQPPPKPSATRPRSRRARAAKD